MGPKLLKKIFCRHTEIGEDYHSLCRLCLTKTGLKLNICLEEGKRQDIQGKMLNCLSLIVTEDDRLPKFVCYPCIDKLEHFQDFRDMCQESESLFKEYLISAGQTLRRMSSSKMSASRSQETISPLVSKMGFVPLEVPTKSETETTDPLFSEQPSVENTWPEDQPYIKTETASSLVAPDVNTTVDSKLTSQYMEETSVGKVESDSNLYSQYMEEISVGKVESEIDEELMHFEGTTQEVPSGQDVSKSEGFDPDDCEEFVEKVPPVDSDNDALILSDHKDRNSVEHPDRVEGEAADPAERYLNENYVEGEIQELPRSVAHLVVSPGELGEQEQPQDNTEHSNGKEKIEAETSAISLQTRACSDHTKNDNRRKQYICSICNKVLSYKAGFIIHERVHTREKPFNCSICNKNFADKRILYSHLRVHTSKPFNCSICNEDFVFKKSLNVHMRLHTKGKLFNCSICNKDFAAKRRLIEHVRVHTKDKPFNCSICNKDFATKGNLNVHMRVHTKEKPFTCSICNKDFADKRNLIRHMRVHNKPFNCSICNKDFATKGNLNVHMKFHTKEKPFNCSICNKDFTTKGNLNVHMRVHTKEKPFTCSICNKDFAVKGSLNEHMKFHTKEKPFNCSICNKDFATKGNLNVHMRVHTKEKPFTCSICNKDFADKRNLIRHMRVHNKEKLFNCSICNKDFAIKHSLTRHVRVHTKEKPFLCSI